MADNELALYNSVRIAANLNQDALYNRSGPIQFSMVIDCEDFGNTIVQADSPYAIIVCFGPCSHCLAIFPNSEHFPESYALKQNYPNPFNPRTLINYELPVTNLVEINIYNLLGQKVAVLVSEEQRTGYYHVEWDATGFSSGIYFYTIKSGDFYAVRKMILMQ